MSVNNTGTNKVSNDLSLNGDLSFIADSSSFRKVTSVSSSGINKGLNVVGDYVSIVSEVTNYPSSGNSIFIANDGVIVQGVSLQLTSSWVPASGTANSIQITNSGTSIDGPVYHAGNLYTNSIQTGAITTTGITNSATWTTVTSSVATITSGYNVSNLQYRIDGWKIEFIGYITRTTSALVTGSTNGTILTFTLGGGLRPTIPYRGTVALSLSPHVAKININANGTLWLNFDGTTSADTVYFDNVSYYIYN